MSQGSNSRACSLSSFTNYSNASDGKNTKGTRTRGRNIHCRKNDSEAPSTKWYRPTDDDGSSGNARTTHTYIYIYIYIYNRPDCAGDSDVRQPPIGHCHLTPVGRRCVVVSAISSRKHRAAETSEPRRAATSRSKTRQKEHTPAASTLPPQKAFQQSPSASNHMSEKSAVRPSE